MGGEEGEIRAWASKCKLSKESGTKKIEPIPFEGAVPVSRPSCSTTAYATKRLTIRTRYAVWKSVRERIDRIDNFVVERCQRREIDSWHFRFV